MEHWRTLALRSVRSADLLYREGDYRGAANRCYYAAYHAATYLCYRHGDETQFSHGWNNPSHEQLPDLIRNNGSLSVELRRQINRRLRELRVVRENADYRPGRTVDKTIALESLRQCRSVLEKRGSTFR